MVLHWRSHGRVHLPSNGNMRRGDVTIGHAGYVMDARSSSVSVHRIEANEVLLSMAGNLCRSS